MAATAANLHFDRRERHRIAATRGRSVHGMRPGKHASRAAGDTRALVPAGEDQ